jgi:hypothetical protein
MNKIFSQLPFDLIREILLYDTHFVLRNDTKKLVCINKIPQYDPRLFLYSTVPRIYERSTNNWSVILGTYPRFVMSRRLKPNLIWEYSFISFRRDPHTNIMDTVASSTIFQPLYL